MNSGIDAPDEELTNRLSALFTDDVEILDDSDDEDQVPMVSVGDEKIPLTDVQSDPQLIAKMTPAEKDAYIQLYQEYYNDMYD